MGGTSGGGTLPVLTFTQRIASSSTDFAVGMCGGCGAVGVFMPVLDTAISWRLSMIF